MGSKTSGNTTPRRGRKLIRRIILSKEAASALRALTAANQTTNDETVLVERLILEAWTELDETYSAAAEAALDWE